MPTLAWIALLLLQGLTLIGIALLWWRARPGAQGDLHAQREDWSREARSLERHIDGKVDLLLAQILAQKPPSLDIESILKIVKTQSQQEWAATVERKSKEQEPSPPTPEPFHLDHLPQVPDRAEEAAMTAERRLALLLGSSDFLQRVWPDMTGPYEVAVTRLSRYLAEDGLPEPSIEPFPPNEIGASSHWLFMTVSYRDPQMECRRFLIPCNYSRYDPLMHDHLFQVLGAGGSVDYFIRELRQCALLEANGDLQGFIPKALVVRKGAFVV